MKPRELYDVMNRQTTWIVDGILVTPSRLVRGSLAVHDGRIVEIRRSASPLSGKLVDAKGQYVAPGFIDLHIWGEPKHVSAREAASGMTSFLHAVGPEPPELLINRLFQLERQQAQCRGAACLGIHLEGPFLNPLRAGALASRWLRPPTGRELHQLLAHADGKLRLLTVAPELPGGLETIDQTARRGIAVSLGHTEADASITQQAVGFGASLVTHAFNGMRSFHHRDPGIVGEMLTDDRLSAMAILDGIHIAPSAFRLLARCKGPGRIILATDSVRHYRERWQARLIKGTYRLKSGTLAGSRLTMIQAVHNAVAFGRLSLPEAVRMSSLNPAHAIGEEKRLGSLAVGKQADLVVFDDRFRVSLTFVNGRLVYRRGTL